MVSSVVFYNHLATPLLFPALWECEMEGVEANQLSEVEVEMEGENRHGQDDAGQGDR